MRSAGPTEIRVRAALIRLWDASGEGEQFSWPAVEVREEVERDGDGRLSSVEAVQRIGCKAAKGQTEFSRGQWSELIDDIEYTYSRGTFTVRRRGAETMPWGTDETPDRDEQTAGYIDVIRSRDDGVKNRNVLGGDDATIQVTWDPDEYTALLTVRGNDHDLTPAQLRSFAAALLEAASDVDPDSPPATIIAQVHEIGFLAGREWGQRPDADCDEPRVTQRHLDMMRHATGNRLAANRNFYIAPRDAAEHIEWVELVEMGLAGDGEPPTSASAGSRKGIVFHVTDAGFRMAYGDVRKASGKRAKR